jgi:phosphoglycolate phosphatase-like HAD superfamily hydrolase
MRADDGRSYSLPKPHIQEIPMPPADTLPSWIDGAAKARIVAFVRAVTDPGGKDFVAPAERVAVFDNDGTLWSEQPMYFQGFFILDRLRALAPQHPEWATEEPYASLLKGDLKAAVAGGMKTLVELVTVSHAGMSSEEFSRIAADWVATARHPQTGRLLTEMTFQPMKELLATLRDHGFKTFIVSGGGIEFMRPWAEATYGIPPEQVIGSSIKTVFEWRDNQPVLMRLPEMNFIDDKEGKPVAINQHIGRRPIAAFGNSDGDYEMLAWTTSAPGLRLGLIVHHDDADREYAYDRQSHFGKLERGLDDAAARGWAVVSMKSDWKTVFASSP